MTQTERNTDEYARDSFSMRGMKRWQVWSISVASIAIIIGLIVYAV